MTWGFEVLGSEKGFRAQGLACRVMGLGFGISGVYRGFAVCAKLPGIIARLSSPKYLNIYRLRSPGEKEHSPIFGATDMAENDN